MMTKKHLPYNSLDLITDSELDELEHFLLSDATPDETMPIDLLDGYFTVLIVGPATPSSSRWLPLVWDMSGGGGLLCDKNRKVLAILNGSRSWQVIKGCLKNSNPIRYQITMNKNRLLK